MSKITNQFYSAFDETRETPREGDYRTDFQRDRDRIIHTSAFRRLQAKTQVFLSGEYDFYRTRLTHSIEVAQIGRSICNYLKQRNHLLGVDYFIDPDLVEATCLAHDLGHPPFGHAGEKTLNRLMGRYGGFEGNAQTLRMMTKIIETEHGQQRGMNPTRALIDGVLKYKTRYSQLDQPENHFLYDEQAAYLDFIFANRPIPDRYPPGEALNNLRSIECQIMDWADDTAYSVNDLIDGYQAGFITVQKVKRWADDHIATEESPLIDELIDAIHAGNIERRYSPKIGDCIRACHLVESDQFMSDLTHRYRYNLEIDPAVRRQVSLYKTLSYDLIFISPQLGQLKEKLDMMLRRIFKTLTEHYARPSNSRPALLPQPIEALIQAETEPARQARLICDYLAGMTDKFAVRIYKRLFDPDFGSIVDLV